MIKLLSCIIILALYLLWKSMHEPFIYLTVQQCRNDHPLPSKNYLQSFVTEQYKNILRLIFHSSWTTKKPSDCPFYKINLQLPILFFILTCSSALYCIKLLWKYLVWIYTQQCYLLLRKQIHPFVHVRSVAFVSRQ